MAKFTKHKWWFLTAILTVPALAIAVPISFTAGTPISASVMNQNFTNIEGRLAAIEGTLTNRVAALETKAPPILNCHIQNFDSGTTWIATCGAGYVVTGGGCNVTDKAAGPIKLSYPLGNAWTCDAGSNLSGTYAICCKNGS